MSDRPDFYDVEAAAAKAANEERAARIRHVEEIAQELRAEIRREVMEARADIGELFRMVREDLQIETDERIAADESLQRTLDARTERLA